MTRLTFKPAALVEAIAAGIRILRTRDGIDIDEAHVMERARNIAMAVMGLVEEVGDAD